MKILIIEDETVLAQTIKSGLEKTGYAVDFVVDGGVGERRLILNHKEYDLVIMDWMLPTKDGMQICKNIRDLKIQIPILMLTARFDIKDRVAALNGGADDYMLKPFSFDELEARIGALLRRPVQSVDQVLEIGRLKVDLTRHKVMADDKIIRLTTKEFAMLEYLMRNQDRVVSREQILDHLWGFDFDSFSNVIDSHIKNLRNKLKDKRYCTIETVRGLGYKIRNF
jgi:two-component system copper resistance phosphate regulon response regulator CusR